MKIFSKRPLSLILFVLLSGFTFSSYSSKEIKVSIPIVAAVIFCVSFFISKSEKRTKMLMRICSAALMISSILSFAYFDLYFSPYDKYQDESKIVGTVTSTSFNNGSNLLLEAEKINGKDESYNFRVYLEKENMVNISNGSVLEITGVICNFDESYDSDQIAYNISRGISAEVRSVSYVRILENGDFTTNYKIESYRDSLCRTIISGSDKNAGGLLCAVLLGERSYLSEQTALDFSRIGISHILALSGMHLAILAFAIDKLLILLKIKKKPRKIIEIILIAAYTVFTGLPISVVRSALMLIISYVIFLLSAKSDSVTNLFISVFLICAIQPYSVFDISLWLSACATFGILALSETISQSESIPASPKTTFKRTLWKISMPLLSSIFAIGFTLLISTTSFKTLSIIGFFTTPIFAILIEGFMYIGMFFLLFTNITPLGALIAYYGDFINYLAGLFSDINGIFISADYATIKILITLLTVMFSAFIILDIKKKKTCLIVISSLFLTVILSSVAFSVKLDNEEVFEYSLENKDERFFIQSESTTALIDVTSVGSASSYESIDYISQSKHTEIDKYIYTDYSKKLPQAVTKLLSYLKTDIIYLPKPTNDEEHSIYNTLLEETKEFRTQIQIYESDDIILIGNISFFPVYRNTEGKVGFTLLYNDNFYSYLSSGMLEGRTKAVAEALIVGCHTLILGRHGNSYSNYSFIYNASWLNTIIASSEGLNIPESAMNSFANTDIISSPKRIDFTR